MFIIYHTLYKAQISETAIHRGIGNAAMYRVGCNIQVGCIMLTEYQLARMYQLYSTPWPAFV